MNESEFELALKDLVARFIDHVGRCMEWERRYGDTNLQPGKKYGLVALSGESLPEFKGRSPVPGLYAPVDLTFDVIQTIVIANGDGVDSAAINATAAVELFAARRRLSAAADHTEIFEGRLLCRRPYSGRSLEVVALRQQYEPPHHWEMELVGEIVLPLMVTRDTSDRPILS